jgi:hypothetical protein
MYSIGRSHRSKYGRVGYVEILSSYSAGGIQHYTYMGMGDRDENAQI